MLAAEKRYPIYEEYYYDYDAYESKSYSEKSKAKVLTAAEKAKLLFLLIGLGTMCIVMIMASAYTSQIKYNINVVSKNINVLEGEIENIVVEIEKESKIVFIEEKAINQLGMIYPSGEQIVFLENPIKQTNFAAAMREEAYH
ncbi:MAG: hypothetical protein GX285_00965 [Clostridiales bacterium]|nr:hypothetical protein [Clostridiales bacterium]